VAHICKWVDNNKIFCVKIRLRYTLIAKQSKCSLVTAYHQIMSTLLLSIADPRNLDLIENQSDKVYIGNKL
jgi:hypothetical protein